ncbi:SPAC3H1.10 [Symbiodinium pilosum]|uniref:SPAC3H1.10 protein n=1 Tax=Symbiodinium pilosum TaxID=2952 RepID=A0A812URV6_SYMPI|nr:SPAC3H1.10 [Symbiodinium pilosum]
MHVLGDMLASRTTELSPQNVSNIVHAFSRLSCYNVRLFQNLVTRVASEDLEAYKLYELGVLCHNLAKLKSGGPKVYGAMFGELAKRPSEAWEPKAVAQVLDAMRRRSTFSHEQLLVLLFERFFNSLDTYPVHPLTQASWCLVELDALDLAKGLGHELPSDESGQGFPAGRFAMRRVFERLEDLNSEKPFTPTQRCHVQQLIRAYRYRFELDFGLLPQKVKSFCKSQFDVSNSVVSAVAWS